MKARHMTDTPNKAPVRAYLIDPANRSIEEVTLTQKPSALAELYKLLDCSTITAVTLDDKETVYCDDEGLLKGPVYQFFSFKGFDEPIAGKGLVIGIDRDGNDASPTQSLENIRQRLLFVECLHKNAWSVTAATRPDVVRIVSLRDLPAAMGAAV